ncbi:MAG: hypothetical protein ACKPBV_12520, partial [Sphaerospermopsis kisseleviana]
MNRWQMEMWGDGEAGEEEAGGAGCRVQGAGCRGRILTFAFCFLLSVTSPQSPVTSHQSPVTSPQSPVPSHQSPVTSPQSPVPSHQSPIST